MGLKRKSGLVTSLATPGKPGNLHKSKMADTNTLKMATFQHINVGTCVIPLFNIIYHKKTISWDKFAFFEKLRMTQAMS